MPPGKGGATRFLSADGRIVVGHYSASVVPPDYLRVDADGTFVWTEQNGITALDGFVATSLSSDGNVVVGYMPITKAGDAYPSARTPLRWTRQAGLVPIAEPTGTWVDPRQLSADGTIVSGLVGADERSLKAFWEDLGDDSGIEYVGGPNFSTGVLGGIVSMSGDGSVVLADDGYLDPSLRHARVIWDKVQGTRPNKTLYDAVTADGKVGYQVSSVGQSIAIGPLP